MLKRFRRAMRVVHKEKIMTKQIYIPRRKNIRLLATRIVCLTLLLAMFNWLFSPLKYSQQRVFAEQNQPVSNKQLSAGEIKNAGAGGGLYFEANQGQLDKRVKFSARGSGYKLFLTSTEAVYVIPERKAEEAQKPKSKGEIPTLQAAEPRRAVAVWMKLAGANPNTEAEGIGELAGKHNYFIGGDESKWHSNVPLYQRASFDNVYPGVDLEWHINEAGSIEYDFKVSPFVSTRQIEWQIEGADKVRVEADGSLVISTPFGDLKQNAPVTYQETDGLRSAVESRFEQRGETSVGFAVGDYDHSKPLTIDPVTDLAYSTFLGGEADESGQAIADGAHTGGPYVTGSTTSMSFPTTTGVFSNTLSGGSDVFVTKFNNDGSGLVYSTYIGGDGYDAGYGIAVDTSGNAYITGVATDSATPYPTTIDAPFPNNSGEQDAFVTKLNATGSALIYSTFIGGGGNDQGLGIAVRSGRAYITGFTQSGNYPTTPGAYQTTINIGSDIFVTKLGAQGANLDYSTFIGGNADDVGRGIAVDGAGDVFICGETPASSYPTTPGAFDTTPNGNLDAVVTKLNAAGSALVYSTFIGGNLRDVAQAIALDASGNAYITGHSWGSTIPYPTTAGAYSTTSHGGEDVFVTKFNPAGSALVYSTLIGGGGFDGGRAIAVNAAGNAFITGYAGTSSDPYPTTPEAFDTTFNGFFDDVFFTKVGASGSTLIYSTFIGGSGNEFGTGIALNPAGEAFLTGLAYDGTIDFPTTAGAFQSVINGASDAFVSKFVATPNAEVLMVTNTNDGGVGSLRQAIQNSNISPDADVVQFSSLFNTPQTISITDHLQILGGLTIQGPGANLLTVRNTSAPTFISRVFYILGGTVNLSGMTITGGKGNLSGGGINNSTGATLTVNNCTISGNSVIQNRSGGGIANYGTLHLFSSTISGNSSGASNINGAIWNEGLLNVINSTISGNPSRAISSSGTSGSTNITNSTIVNNVIDMNATGLYLFNGTMTVRGSIVTGNHPGGPDVLVASGTLISTGYNIIGDASAVIAFNQPTDQTGTTAQPLNPRLGPLAFNGGTTQTHMPFLNSTALDRGHSSGTDIDQRGLIRPFDIPGIFNIADGSDIGAVERQGNKSPFDFDGDGKTDIGIFRPGPAEWWYQRSSNGQVPATQFGATTDKIVPGDYTGDGKADIAVWRPSTGFWYVIRSEDNSFFAFPFGQNGDVPVPADYDNDGKFDTAVFRPSNATWFIPLSGGGGTSIFQFGITGDQPTVADYDGDGKADVAIFRPGPGEWWIQRSTAGILAFQFGAGTDKPVQGDYTGDGKADAAFWRPSNGFWYIIRSEDFSFFALPFGQNGDIVAPGDYDGDGKFDLTVFRPTQATWYIQRTTAGTLIVQFGINGDRPIANAFVP